VANYHLTKPVFSANDHSFAKAFDKSIMEPPAWEPLELSRSLAAFVIPDVKNTCLILVLQQIVEIPVMDRTFVKIILLLCDSGWPLKAFQGMLISRGAKVNV
jgi:hypothetical protein